MNLLVKKEQVLLPCSQKMKRGHSLLGCNPRVTKVFCHTTILQDFEGDYSLTGSEEQTTIYFQGD